jgi:hypothetical protein
MRFSRSSVPACLIGAASLGGSVSTVYCRVAVTLASLAGLPLPPQCPL